MVTLTRIPEDLIARAERHANVSGHPYYIFRGPDGDWWALTEEEMAIYGWKLEDLEVVYSTKKGAI